VERIRERPGPFFPLPVQLLQVLRTFFEYAKTQGYLAKDHDELEGISLGECGSWGSRFTRQPEMTALLSKAGPEMVPFLAIQRFLSGLRKQDWERWIGRKCSWTGGFIDT